MYWFSVLLCWNTTVDLQGLWTISFRTPFHTTAYPGIQLWTYDACGHSRLGHYSTLLHILKYSSVPVMLDTVTGGTSPHHTIFRGTTVDL